MLGSKILFTGFVCFAFAYLLRMPARDITRRIEPLCWMSIDPPFRDLPVWNIFRWFMLLLLVLALILVWFPR